MATIKSYTDINQSKKLAEILPLESADMHYVLIDTDEDKYDAGLGKYIGILSYYPCWSLAALLGVFEDKGFYYKLYFDGVSNVLEIINIDNPNIYKMIYNDNPIDACVAMVEKLNELNLL